MLLCYVGGGERVMRRWMYPINMLYSISQAIGPYSRVGGYQCLSYFWMIRHVIAYRNPVAPHKLFIQVQPHHSDFTALWLHAFQALQEFWPSFGPSCRECEHFFWKISSWCADVTVLTLSASIVKFRRHVKSNNM